MFFFFFILVTRECIIGLLFNISGNLSFVIRTIREKSEKVIRKSGFFKSKKFQGKK